ncbi:interleukin-7 receptor subunit alpha [Phascolarctos cinereus]|uniref:Interleukin-7 receptor subunit alpha n=1 Tax=Phascolarctos cinereus TaxID=38626 RepID=A0A6P5KZL8_PHACI|nr:interleukin-7 receptor subunit alpha [Phascolarctos cinereus]
MTVLSTTIGIIFFLLHSSSGESGFGQDDEFEDEEQDDYEFTCYSQLQVHGQQHTLTCSFNDSSLNSTNLGLELCGAFMSNTQCEMMTKREKDYFMKSRSFSLINVCELCVILGKNKVNCKTLKITKIVKPEAPFDINITYRKAANDFVLTFNTTHLWNDYVKDLVHDIAYHQENSKSNWMHISSAYPLVTLLERKLQPNSTYEVKVRSLPGGTYFAGSWSDWSPSVYFRTPLRPKTEELDYVMLIIVTLSFFSGILGIVVICLLWEKRIKPVLWPNLPDHKTTLEQLCRKPQKNLNISFNPESFLDYPIHKVDGIQAKEEAEGFLQVPLPRDINVTEKIGLSPDWPSENNIIPPVVYGGNSPPACLHGNFNTCDLSMVMASKSPNHQENSKSETHFCGGLLLSSDSRNSALTFPFPLRLGVLAPNPAAQGQPINANLRLSQEEAYVTMSSFYQNK